MDLRINNETTNNFLKLSVYYFWMCILNYKLDKWSDYHFTCFSPPPLCYSTGIRCKKALQCLEFLRQYFPNGRHPKLLNE